MKKTRISKRLIALAVSALMIISIIPAVFAADPQVTVINNSPTAFVAGFGRMNFEGKAYQAFRTFADGFAALGAQGGTIIGSGNLDMSTFADIDGRAPLTITGTGTSNTANIVNFPAAVTELELKGDLTLGFVTMKNSENFVIKVGSNSFSTTSEYDTYFDIPDHIAAVRRYYPSPSVFAGKGDGFANVTLDAGNFATVGAGGYESAGSVLITANGANIENLYAGVADENTTVNGDVRVKVNGGSIDTLVAGSASGTVNGNVFVEIDGGMITNAYAGSDTVYAPVNGNAVMTVKNTSVSKLGAPKNNSVSGKIIYVTDTEASFVADAYYDYYVLAKNGFAKPVFDGTTLLGFNVTDEIGCPAGEILVNGTKTLPVNGVFAIPEGKSTIEVVSGIELKLNPYAKYVSGYEDGTFLPQNNLSRAEAITMLCRLVVDENTIKGSVKSSYADVDASAWFTSYIGLFETLGYLDTVTKDAGTKIDPNAKITRGEFVELARNVIRLMNPRDFGGKSFSDVPSSHPYAKSIGEIGYLGIIGGYEDGTFRPDNNITRAEVVTIINRMLSRVPTENEAPVSFSDIGDHWAKQQITLAANESNVGGVEIWKIDGDVTRGNFKLLENASLDEQIVHLYDVAKAGDNFATTSGIDMVSDWQIDNIVYSESDYSTITGTKYYISPNGDDTNDGLSPETAWKSLAMASNATKIKAGDGVLFERGAVFRGRFNTLSGVTYSAYGVGEKPRFYGSLKNYADPALWEAHDKYENIWVCTEKFSQDVGVMIFNTDYKMGNYNETAGRKYVSDSVRDPSKLTTDLQFFYYFGKLYLYSKANPGDRFESIEIGTNGSLVGITGNDIVIDNLHFRYHGGHVIGTGNRKNITCKNSIFAYTGGSVLSGTTLYGNAFESYGGCDGWYAYNNWMYQIYDTGVTHQYTPTTGECIQKNVEYIGNVIEYCHWGIEYYNHDSTDGSTRIVDNVKMYDNIVRMTAYGWGSRGRAGGATAFCSAGITENTTGFIAERNIIDRSQGRCIMISSPGDAHLVFDQNIIVQKEGANVGDTHEGWLSADKGAVKAFEALATGIPSLMVINSDISIVNNIKDPVKQ